MDKTSVKARIFLSTLENGQISLDDNGFEFRFKNPRMGETIQFDWSEVQKIEVTVFPNKKIGKEFALYTTRWAKMNFFSRQSPLLLKLIGERIGQDKIMHAKNIGRSLLSPFRIDS